MQRKLLIADDLHIIRAGLKLLLQSTLEGWLIGEASSCAEIMKELAKGGYTHCILDIVLPDGSVLEILPNLKAMYPAIRIMVFSVQPEGMYNRVLTQYGIEYYVSKSSTEPRVRSMIEQFLNSEPAPRNTTVSVNPFSALAGRELEVLHYILKGIGITQTGKILNLEPNTVSTLKARILKKTGTRNVLELIELAALYNISTTG